MLLLAVLPSDAVPSSLGCLVVPGGVPSLVDRQAACSALVVPDKCATLQRLIDEDKQDDSLARSLVVWVIVVAGVRLLASLVNHAATKTCRLRSLWESAVFSMYCRLAVVGLSAWQLTRGWDVLSLLVETRLLALAVTIDASLAVSCFYRVVVMAAALTCARVLCVIPTGGFVSDLGENHPHFVLSRRPVATGDPHPPTCVFSELTSMCLRDGGAGDGPRILRGQLQLLVHDHEFVEDGLRKFIMGFMTGPSGVLWGVFVLCLYACHAVAVLIDSCASRSHRRRRFPVVRSSVRNALANALERLNENSPLRSFAQFSVTRWASKVRPLGLPKFLWFAHAHFVCLNGHVGD